MLNHLCRISHAYEVLGGQSLHITIMDDDVVTEANLGRQAFCAADIGVSKAVVLAQRARAFSGCQVDAIVDKHDGSAKSIKHTAARHYNFDLIVSCTDSLEWRIKHAKGHNPDTYWLDLGNSESTGQCVLGGHGLPNIVAVLPEMRKMRKQVSRPSCSMAESLARQDLFINSTLATLGGHLLWQLIRHGGLNHHGYIANLSAGVVRPIPCPA